MQASARARTAAGPERGSPAGTGSPPGWWSPSGPGRRRGRANERPGGPNPLLDAALNLAAFHKQHERFYASSPLESALRLQRHARALLALADRWATVEPSAHRGVSPFEGAEDLNSEAATALDGVLFMEGEGRPAEVTAMIGELRGKPRPSPARASGWRTPCKRPGSWPRRCWSSTGWPT